MKEIIDIKHTPPKNGIYEKAKKKWNVDFDSVVFTYGDTIHCKHGLSKDLFVHERTHVRQQAKYKGGPKAWWERYLEDDQFRYDQELAAYKVQYRWVKEHVKDRMEAFRLLRHFASSLSGEMYGSLVSYQEASIAIKK